ncbi:hypothetical protein KW797_01540 [Candidatus Parcubacteria bacterium]|nr:hypothetical protein [Candidatus Parcubacteria bacterium]
MKRYQQFIKPKDLKGVLLLVCITDNEKVRRLVHDVAIDALVKVECRWKTTLPIFPVYPRSIDEARARGFLETPPQGGESYIVEATYWPPRLYNLTSASQPL